MGKHGGTWQLLLVLDGHVLASELLAARGRTTERERIEWSATMKEV
jgi:hypothetical protein